MCITKSLAGGVTLAFGAGVLLSTFLPCTAIVVVQAVAIVGVGVLFLGRW